MGFQKLIPSFGKLYLEPSMSCAEDIKNNESSCLNIMVTMHHPHSTPLSAAHIVTINSKNSISRYYRAGNSLTQDHLATEFVANHYIYNITTQIR